jgi:hypothetical protein
MDIRPVSNVVLGDTASASLNMLIILFSPSALSGVQVALPKQHQTLDLTGTDGM